LNGTDACEAMLDCGAPAELFSAGGGLGVGAKRDQQVFERMDRERALGRVRA
jgi:hypothetical protein